MPRPQSAILPKTLLAKSHEKRSLYVSQAVVDTVTLDAAGVYARLLTRPAGLTTEEADARLTEHGQNVLAKDQRPGFVTLLWRAVRNPLVILLALLATVSFATGDPRAATMMLLMIALSVGLRLVQEAKANSAAAKLKAMISVNATVLRGGTAQEIAVAHLVPGDVVQLAAGDMIPGDVRVVQAKDLFVIQGSLTGESFPVEKFAVEKMSDTTSPLELTSIAFLGTSVGSGAATAVVVATGKDTYLGGMAEALQEHSAPTAFDRGISRFTMLMLGFMAVMVPLVFVINGITRGTWGEAFFFSVAVAVGLTPEMLPMIVTICLSKGVVAMGKRKVIIKRINAIQNLGAMDVLCVDKTGTLTKDEIVLERHCDVLLRESADVLALAYINSHFQTGLKNVLDRAVLAHEESHSHARVPELAKVDEIPFDFERRIMSVVVRTPEGNDRIISKGAPEAIFLEKSLLVLDLGVLEGRKVFSNIIKYVRMGASSNFGNMFSVLGASFFVPFLPMRPIQILANNMLYDIGQAAIPTDLVDLDRIQKPRTWDISELTRFILFIGPCSSIFDYSTYFLMLYVFKCWDVSTPAAAAHSQSLFQTGWFVESLLTQTLIIHVIRTNKIPFLQSRPSAFLLATSVTTMAIGVALPFTPLGRYLGFTSLPPAYWLYIAVTLFCYVLLTQAVKTWLLRHRWI